MNLFVFLFIVLVAIFATETKSDEIPGFFLKVTKNVPRLGRRSGSSFENYFRKTSKSVPRVGRRNGLVESEMPLESDNLWYDRLLNPAKRAVISSDYYAYSLVQPMDANTVIELLAKDLFPSDQLRFISWKDFDDALQRDEELYGKVASLGQDPRAQLTNDLRKFVPIYNNQQNNDLYYYKTIQNNRKPNEGKEVIDFHI